MRAARRACIAAGLAILVLTTLSARPGPARAEPPDTLTFGSLPQAAPRSESTSFWARHRAPLLVTGAVLAASTLLTSQLLLAAANRRYDDYLASPDPQQMERFYQDAHRLDTWSKALLVVGEAAAGATLVVAWRTPEHGALAVGFVPLPGGAGVKLAWVP
ncbi:MAG TPA: hypothetical protein VMS93_02030 [Candidatus Saccharimonadales bacterium]|nr:hypothetical protein [Candidatus Saccharimonadales bacterium]